MTNQPRRIVVYRESERLLAEAFGHDSVKIEAVSEPIDVHTLWLGFDDGQECAISMDLTGWNAAMRRAMNPPSD